MIQNYPSSHIHKKHCSGLCCKVNKISSTLNNLVQQLRCRSVNNPNFVYNNLPQIEHRHIPSQYLKVTQTKNNIDGVEYLKIPRHHTDNTEMKKVLEWDQKDQFTKPRQQYNSKMIKLYHDKRVNQLQKMRKQGEEKDWYHQQRIQKSRTKIYDKDRNSPRFNNQIIQKKTEQAIQYSQTKNQRDFSKQQEQKTRPIKSKNKQYSSNKYKQQQHYHQTQQRNRNINMNNKKNRNNRNNKYEQNQSTNQRNNHHANDYAYRKRVITRYRSNDQISVSSTDSQFSRFQS